MIISSKIDFETTRKFLEKKVLEDKNLNKLALLNNNLYYEENLLLNKVISYNKTINTFVNISICIKKDLEICQDMVFKSD